MLWSVYPFHCISFRGQFFDIWEGDFSPFSAACSGDRSRSISCVSWFCGVDLPDASSSSHPVISSVSSCVAFELVKTVHVMTHPLPAPSHHLIHSIAPLPAPSLDTLGGAVFSACRFAVGVDAVVLAVYRAVSSHRFPVSLLLPSGRFALPVASGLSCVVLASPCRHAVGGDGGVSSPLAPLVRYGERGAGSGRCLRRGGMVFSCPHGVVSSRPVIAWW